MSETAFYESPETQKKIFTIYREYFDRAERNRRWSLVNDIPWDQANPSIDPRFADVVQTFCMVELFLPDYISKQLPQVRSHRGKAWMLANWGYEESKHSLALGDWLLKAKQRTDEQMIDMENAVSAREYHLHTNNARAQLCYTTLQELATQLHYRNLKRVAKGACPALDKCLHLVAVDEAAHHDFFRRILQLHLEEDRAATIDALRGVIQNFRMPAAELFSESARRQSAVRELEIFNEEIFLYEVIEPSLQRLGLTRQDIKKRVKREWAHNVSDVPAA